MRVRGYRWTETTRGKASMEVDGDDVKRNGKSWGSRGLLCKRKAKLSAMQLAN